MSPLRRVFLSHTAITILVFSAVVDAQVCDVDANGYIDSNDITLIFSATNTPAAGPDDPRDADADGLITINDASLCTLQCTLSNCDVVTANSPPTANAGPDQSAFVGDSVILDGSGSSDPDGDALSFRWTIVARPTGSNASLSDSAAVNPGFVVDVFGTYEVQLVVNDGKVDSVADTVLVTTENSAPVASAGPDQTAYAGTLVTLDGSASYDVDGDPLTYTWTVLASPGGSNVLLSNNHAVNPSFIIDLPGGYEFGLTVNDGSVDSAPDSVVITTINSPPVADAGPDQSALVNDVVTLDGSGSTDVDGDPLTYSWSLTTRPVGSSAVLSLSDTVNPGFTLDVNGTYVAQLIVNDGKVDSSPDTVVISTVNSPPVANAGANQIAYVGDTVTLDGSASSDVDGDALTFSWSFVSRPSGSAATLSDSTAVMPVFAVDEFGTYVVQLIVNDGTVNSVPDTVTIDIQNSAPVANAGPDQTVLVGETVNLDGSGSHDVDGDTLTYHWAMTSQPAGSSAILSDPAAVNPTFAVDLPGEYVVQLIVNDGHVDSAVDHVVITTGNSRPVADAGPNQTVYVGDSVVLDGSGSSDADGDTLSYAWSIISAPAGSSATLSDKTAISPTITPDVAGAYVIQLIVKDAALSSAPDSAAINVLALPELSINDPLVLEGDAGTTDLIFTVTLSPASTREITVDYATAVSTATPGVDYTPTSGSLTFAPGVTSQPIIVSVNGDTETEPNEFLFVNLSKSVNAVIADAQGIGTIQNDDAALSLTLTPQTLNLLTHATGVLTVTLNTPATAGGVVVNLTSDDTSVATVPASVTIAEGLSGTTIDVTAGSIVGTSGISAAATGFASDSSTVNVANRVMSIELDGPLVGVGRSIGGKLNLAQAAPTGGVTVSLSSANTGFVTLAPASVFIAAGENSVDFNVSGVAEGATTITATAPGYEPATADIAATSNLISIDVLPPLAPEQVIGLPVSLSTPAPTGGVTVYFSIANPAIASVTSSVFVPEGLRIATANPQVTGNLIGSTTITASAVGYAPHTRDITVTLNLSFTPDPLHVVNGGSADITVNLSAPAPSSGITLNLTTEDNSIATVPATINISAGQTSATIAVSGVAAGNTVLHANAPGITGAAANIIVESPPISIYADQIGKDLQRPVDGYIGAPAPAGNLAVTLTSSDPTRLLLAKNSVDAGSASITVTVPAGTTSIPRIYAQSLADNSTVDIVASAPLYATDTETVQLVKSTFIFEPLANVDTTTFSDNTRIRILPARIDPASGQSQNDHVYRSDAVRGGLSVTINFNSSDAGVGAMTGPVTLNGGDPYNYGEFDPVAAGTTELSIVQPSGFSAALDARDHLNANVTAPKIMLYDMDIGIDLQRPIDVRLESAPPTPTDITVTVADNSVAIVSANASNAGSQSVTFTGVTTTLAGTIYVQGLSLNNTTITAQGTGYTTGASTIVVQPSSLYFYYGDINTNTFAADRQMRINVTRLDPATSNRLPDIYYKSSLRGGLSVPITITNSDPTVGVLTTPVVINGGDEFSLTYFNPLAAGTTQLAIVQPGNFSVPADGSDHITATVTAPDIYMEDRILGVNLQRSIPVTLQSVPPGATDVTISSNNPGMVLVSRDAAAAGSASVTFTGVTSTNVGLIYVQGIALGNTTITATATGYNNSTHQVSVENAAIYFYTGDTQTDTFAGNSNIVIRGDRLNPINNYVIHDTNYPSSLRGGLDLTLPVSNSDTTVGEIANAPIIFHGGSDNTILEFDPLTAGVTSLAITQPPGFTAPADGKSSINVTVHAPKVILDDRIVGKNLQRYIPVRLESAPPSPVDVVVSMSSGNIAWLSKDATAAGSQTVTFSGVTSTTVGQLYVQGINLGSAVITGKASGYADAVNDISVTPAGFYIANGDFTWGETSANYTITIQADRLDPVTLNVIHDNYYPASIRGGLNVSVPVGSSNTAVGIITTSPVILNGGDYNGHTEFDPIAAGNTELSVPTPAGFSTPSNRTSINVTVTAATTEITNTTPVINSDDSVNKAGDAQTSSGSGSLGWFMLILLIGMNLIGRARSIGAMARIKQLERNFHS